MADSVKVSVRSDLEKILNDLGQVNRAAEDVAKTFKKTGEEAGDALGKQTKKTENFVGGMRNMVRRAADQMKGDFKALFAINAIGDSLKLSSQFRGSIREAVTLNDMMRKLHQTFGMTQDQGRDFTAGLVRDLGKVGLGGEAATNALQALAETPVRGAGALGMYTEQSGLIARATGQSGREGDIAKGVSDLLMARGLNPNNQKEAMRVFNDLARVRIGTGASPTGTLETMKRIFERMPQDLRKTVSTQQLSQLAIMGQQGGPGATKFLENLLGKSKIDRLALNSMGYGKVFGKQGIDVDELQKALKGTMGMIGGDPRKAAEIITGGDQEAAEGLVRLSENMERVKKTIGEFNKVTDDQAAALKNTMGFGEAFRANIERIKSVFATPLMWGADKATNLLGSASKTNTGSLATVLGGGALAALLAGGATRVLGRSMLGGMAGSMAKGAIAGQVTGKDVIPVYVVNAGEMGGGGGVGSVLGGAGAGAGAKAVGLGMAGRLGLMGLAAVGGVAIGKDIGDAQVDARRKAIAEGGVVSSSKLDMLYDAVGTLLSALMAPKIVGMRKDLYVKTDDPRLKITAQPTRGGSN